jgi:serine/threonine protein kinase
MGEVYRAKELRLGRDVAIKIVPEHLSSNPDAMRRFELEARALKAYLSPVAVKDGSTSSFRRFPLAALPCALHHG